MSIEIRRAALDEAAELTANAFAAKRHWGYPEAWIDLWVDELSIDSRYIEENSAADPGSGGARTAGSWVWVSVGRLS